MFLELQTEELAGELSKVVSLYLEKGKVALPEAKEDGSTVSLATEVSGDVVLFRCVDSANKTYAVGHAFVAETKEDGSEVVQAIVHQPMTTTQDPKSLYLYKGKAFMRRRGF